MDFFTHLVFGALIYTLFLKEVTFTYFIFAMFFAILPDLDIFLSPLRRVSKSNYLEHRSGSHSYIIGIIIAGIVGAIYSILTQKSFIIVWIIGMIFYGIHVSLDLLTTTKIPCFYPISKKEYCFYVEKAGSSFTLLTSWVFIAILSIVFNLFRDINLFFLIINIYTYFIVGYYIFRVFTKIWIGSRLKENQKYFPGVLPFYFFIFEKEIVHNTISLQIEKRSHISRTRLLYNNDSDLTPQEMGIFNKGMELCMKNYYFAKWTVLPVFFRNDGVFSIKFFFLEPMVHSRALFVQYNFDINTERLIGDNQGYSRFDAIP